ncbi:MAG: cyclic nucleotide-binding domain-containing protein [bacterium]|nr:cyclic nucleotide-binding domain-containing protein [bacterium]
MLSWLQGKQDVNRLIAKGQYPKAIKILQRHVRANPKSVHLRKMLADVLERDGQKRRAIEVLEGLVQEFSSEGFVTKAIAVLKKIQRIDPEQSDAEVMLDTLVKMRRKNQPPAKAARTQGPPPAAPRRAAEPKPKEKEEDLDEGLVTSIIMPSEFWFEEAAARRDGFNWSPLFGDFSKEELSAMIGGMRLLIKKPGSIIYTEGEPGDSLFVLASGIARVYRKTSIGHNDQVAVLRDGAVFGTPSVLLEKPRNRTIIAVNECELLELDKATFDGIAAAHPRVAELVHKLHTQRG